GVGDCAASDAGDILRRAAILSDEFDWRGIERLMRLQLSMTIGCAVLIAACAPAPVAPREGAPAPRTFAPIRADRGVLWDRQTTETRALLQGLVEQFNASHPGMPVEAEYIGGYAEIYKKVSAGIGAGTLPSMAVAYESMTVEYIEAGAVYALDNFAGDAD